MPCINRGLKWEVDFRRKVRRMRKGLTASANGRGAIKSTQLVYRDLNNQTKTDYVCTQQLPWTKKSSTRNLEIIRDALNLMDNSDNLNIKLAVMLSASNYDLKILKQKQTQMEKIIND